MTHLITHLTDICRGPPVCRALLQAPAKLREQDKDPCLPGASSWGGHNSSRTHRQHSGPQEYVSWTVPGNIVSALGKPGAGRREGQECQGRVGAIENRPVGDTGLKRGHLSKGLEGVRESAMWLSGGQEAVSQAQVTAGAKREQRVQGSARRTVGWVGGRRGVREERGWQGSLRPWRQL